MGSQIMENLFIISCFILLILTCFYVFLTYRLLNEVKQANESSRDLLEKQLRLSNFPFLYCDLQHDIQAGQTVFTIYNIGNVPTYDIHVSTIGVYTEEGMDIPTFLRTFVHPKYRKYPLSADKVGYYGVRNSARCSILPFQKSLSIAFVFPTRPIDVYAMLQYRDILGKNYHQGYCFSDFEDKGDYRANILEPVEFEPLDRFHFYHLDDAKFPESGEAVPYHISDFIDLWNHSISYRFTTAYSEEVDTPQEVAEI